jgi:SAM-dependent methyltransferase
VALAQALPAEAAYDQLAPHYDSFTAGHDYELWFDHLLPAVECFGLPGRRLLDVGCGTGKSFLGMLDRGWEVTAFDASPEMVRRAKMKAEGRARVEVADMRQLPALGAFDLVWSLGDVVNYLLTVEELERAVAGMAGNLAPGGLLLFDTNTLLTYRTLWAERQAVSVDGGQIVWQGRASADAAPGSTVSGGFQLDPAGGTKPVRAGVHRQRHFRPEETQRALRRAGLTAVGVFGQGFDAVLEQPLWESRHTKAVFIAQRQERR